MELRPIGDARKLSIGEFADQFETVVKEREDLAIELDKARAEIIKLKGQLADLSRKDQTAINDRTEYLLEAREKLIRDEFERKYQELTVEVRNQRKKYTQQIDAMKKQLKNCMCQSTTWD